MFASEIIEETKHIATLMCGKETYRSQETLGVGRFLGAGLRQFGRSWLLDFALPASLSAWLLSSCCVSYWGALVSCFCTAHSHCTFKTWFYVTARKPWPAAVEEFAAVCSGLPQNFVDQ